MTIVPSEKVRDRGTCVFNSDAITRSVSRLSYEILEHTPEIERLALVGIRTGGEFLARRLQERLQEIEGRDIPLGVIDITLYRDDLSSSSEQPQLKGTELPFRVSGRRIVLVDDVLFTGRTVRAALDAIIDFGRPERVELAVLVDRGHREFPIRPDYVGKNIPTQWSDSVRVLLSEQGGRDGVYLLHGEEIAPPAKTRVALQQSSRKGDD